LHQVGDLFELNIKLRCQKVKPLCTRYIHWLTYHVTWNPFKVQI